MSLLLRKQCQQLLDDVKLDNYHVQVDEGSKCLQIVGECGQVLVSITGIRLSRMAPNSAEIELALELFDVFLAKHTGTFNQFIAAKARADQAKIPTATPFLKKADVTKASFQDFWTLQFAPRHRPEEIWSLQSNGKLLIPAQTLDIEKPAVETALLSGLSLHEYEDMMSWFEDCKEYQIATKEKNACLSTLSSCEI